MKLDIALASYPEVENSTGEVVTRDSTFTLKDLQRDDWEEFQTRTYNVREIRAALNVVLRNDYSVLEIPDALINALGAK